MRLHTPTDRITTTARALPPRTQTAAGPRSAARKAASSRGSSRRGGNRPLIACEPTVKPRRSRASAGCSQLRYISETTEASALSLRPAVGERRLREAWAANGPPPTTRSAVRQRYPETKRVGLWALALARVQPRPLRRAHRRHLRSVGGS